ncbi:MAG: TonB-dependent receptor [Deltaproteobacteria bacterium]
MLPRRYQPTLALALAFALHASRGHAQAREPSRDDAAGAAPVPAGSEAPQAITVRAEATRRAPSEQTLSASELRAVPRASAAELLTAASGFFLSQHGGEGKAFQFFVRGFNAEHGQDVEFTVGGVPSNDVSNAHGQGYADLAWMIPEVVDEVRVLEGPFDPRQGDFAVAGSARFDLGVRERGERLAVTYGMFGTARVVAVVAPRSMRRESFLAGELSRGDGFGPHRAWSRATALGQFVLPLGEHDTVRVMAGTYAGRWDTAGVVREPDLLAGRQGFFDASDPRQGGFSTRHTAALEVIHASGPTRASLTVYGALRDFSVREDFTGYLIDARGDRYQQTYQAGLMGLAGSMRTTFAFGSFEVGVSARHDRTTQAMRRLQAIDDTPYRTEVDADVAATDIALYADVELPRLVGALRVRGGVRVDGLAYHIDDHLPREASRPDSPPRGTRDALGIHIGPRVTVEYGLGRGFSVSGAYGNGFRSPQALSLGNGENAPFAQVHAGEAGMRYRGVAGSFSLAGFVTHIDHDLIFDPRQGQNLAIPESEATTRLGVAASVRATPLRGVVVLLSGTWSHASFDATGYLVPYVPVLVGRLDATIDRQVATVREQPLRLYAGVGATLLGPRPLPYAERSDPVGLVDMGGGARLGPFDLSVSIRNLFDVRWHDGEFNYPSNFDPNASASRVPVRNFTAGRPFTLLATLGVTL